MFSSVISATILHYIFTVPQKKDIVLEQFNRTNSVRDRMRKFTEPTQSSNVTPFKKDPPRNGTTSGIGGKANLSRVNELFTPAAASLSTSGNRPARPHVNATSHTSATSQNHTTPQARGVAKKPLSSADQWQNSVGGTRHPAEKDLHASTNSKEDEAPGRVAGQQVTQGEADPDMKTFLTVEIKDGRASTSSTSSPRGNIVPITNLTPRINTAALGQRAGRTLTATTITLSLASIAHLCRQSFMNTCFVCLFYHLMHSAVWVKLDYIDL